MEIGTSQEAADILIRGESDVAASAQPLSQEEKSKGLVEHPLCTDKLVIITNPKNSLTNLTLDQIRDIFSKKITNSNQAGGKDMPLTLIVPAANTALYQSFLQKSHGR